MNHPGAHATGGANTDSAAAAALRGASLAFHKRKPSAPPSPNRSSLAVGNGALAAATLSTHSTGGSATGLPEMDAAASRSIVAARLQHLGQQQQNPHQNHQHQQFLQPPTLSSPSSSPSPGRVDSKSPSFIAATLAASRSVSPSPKARSPRRRVSVGAMSVGSSVGEVVDSGSIAPTGSLISMFEGGNGARPASGKKEAERSGSPARARPAKRAVQERPLTPSAKPPVEIRSRLEEPTRQRRGEDTPGSSPATGEVSRKPSRPPKPAALPRTPSPDTRSMSRTQTVSDSSSNRVQPPTSPNVAAKKPSKPTKPDIIPPSSPLEPVISRSEPEVLSPTPTRVTKPQLPPPTPPQYQRTISRPSPQTPHLPYSPGDPQKKDTPRSQHRPLQPEPQKKQQPPTPPKPRGSNRVAKTPADPPQSVPLRPRTTAADRTLTNETTSTNEEFVSAPTTPDHGSPPPLARSLYTVSPSLSPTRRSYTPSMSHAQSSQNLDLDSLTNAIMAGSLASSRMTPSHTGSSLPPALPKRQKSPRLRQTMRTMSPASDDENARHRKGHHHRHKLRSGKHAHHEGSRKKWRDEIRPRERKRYEAVWASNRGTLLPTPPPLGSAGSSTATGSTGHHPPDYANSVANVVVRDIWRRSRLPEDELAEVWDLVDRERRGLLGRPEFVVGMWLIDQRLRGRKIPPKVSNSVWGSASGVQVMGPKRHKKK